MGGFDCGKEEVSLALSCALVVCSKPALQLAHTDLFSIPPPPFSPFLVSPDDRHARIVEMRKTRQATRMYHTRLLALGWHVLAEPHRQMMLKEKAVSAQHAWNILGRCWRVWNREVAVTRSRDERRYAFAREHFSATLKVKMLAAWQDGARVLKAERRADLRRRQLRSKVDLWLEEDRAGGRSGGGGRGGRGAVILETIGQGVVNTVGGVGGVDGEPPAARRRERNPYNKY